MSSGQLVSLPHVIYHIESPEQLMFSGLWILTYSSDHFKERLNHILVSIFFVILGGILVTQLEAPHARYGALCIMQIGNFAFSPLQVALLANNTPPPGHRALILAVNSMTNLGGVIASVGIYRLRKRFRTDFQCRRYSFPNTLQPIGSHSTLVLVCPSFHLSDTSVSGGFSCTSTAGGPRRWRP
jgi:hypothetical protein